MDGKNKQFSMSIEFPQILVEDLAPGLGRRELVTQNMRQAANRYVSALCTLSRDTVSLNKNLMQLQLNQRNLTVGQLDNILRAAAHNVPTVSSISIDNLTEVTPALVAFQHSCNAVATLRDTLEHWPLYQPLEDMLEPVTTTGYLQ
jgi:hypothetical protein